MSTAKYTRREVRRLTPEIRDKYRALVYSSDLAGFEKLLAQYPHIPTEAKRELIEDFKQYAARALSSRWRRSK
jgi:hypothetical protein